MAERKEGVTKEVAEKLLELQKRCLVCGGTYQLQIHHRVFKSEGDSTLEGHLIKMSSVYSKSYKRQLDVWRSIHEIQNLVVLCLEHHEGNGVGVHGGNEKLRQQLRNSFTCPVTGFNIPFYKINKPY